MRLHDLSTNVGAKHSSKRVGRGIGSGHGKTSTRGMNGQKARAGGGVRPGFEGGQTPLYMRMRKHGGRAQNAMPQRMFQKEYAIINVSSLQKLAEELGKETAITPDVLIAQRVVRDLAKGVRVLGDGELSLPVKVYAHHFSASARAKVEAAGGQALILTKGSASDSAEKVS